MTDISTAQDALFAAAPIVEEWRKEFTKQWIMPLMKQQARIRWAQMPPEMKEQMKAQMPDEYNQIVSFLEE